MKKQLISALLIGSAFFPAAQATYVEALAGSCGTRMDGYAIRSYFGSIDLDVYAPGSHYSDITKVKYAHMKQAGDQVIMYWAVLSEGTADMISFQIGDKSCHSRGIGFGGDTFVYYAGPYS